MQRLMGTGNGVARDHRPDGARRGRNPKRRAGEAEINVIRLDEVVFLKQRRVGQRGLAPGDLQQVPRKAEVRDAPKAEVHADTARPLWRRRRARKQRN